MSTRTPLLQSAMISSHLQALLAWLRQRTDPLKPILQFMIVSLTIVVSGMGLVGWWVASQVERNVVERTSKAVAVYIDSLLAPVLQDLTTDPHLSVGSVRELQWLLSDTGIGRQIVSLKIWDSAGRILYSDDPALIGQIFPVEEDLEASWHGEITGEISALESVVKTASQLARCDRLSRLRMSASARWRTGCLRSMRRYASVGLVRSSR
jgi:hypothetical protein